MKVSLITIFLKSLYSPGEIAKYRFLTIGKTIQYVFILSLFLSLHGIYDAVVHNPFSTEQYGDEAFDDGSKIFMTLIVIVMTYGLNSGLLFLGITMIASFGEPLAKTWGRKLPYRQSWRLTACSITLPVVLFGLLYLFGFGESYFLLIALAMSVAIIAASIKCIPKPRVKKQINE
ncbi:DUF1189 family protein [Siminovitchia sediminis]|uniref:DUF1189 family protein n=1 Tax=Siminovitchia sediminis TaxID=1274353 RepID=A0ABW4KDL2_9BACI